MSDSGFDMGLEDVSQAGVYGVGDGDLGGLAAVARDAGLRVCRIDLEDCADKRTLLMRLGTQLDFPAGCALRSLRQLGRGQGGVLGFPGTAGRWRRSNCRRGRMILSGWPAASVPGRPIAAPGPCPPPAPRR